MTYFFECKDSNVGSYGNDRTLYVFGENILAVILALQSLAFTLFKWYENNSIKANPGKSHILLRYKKTEKVKITMLY